MYFDAHHLISSSLTFIFFPRKISKLKLYSPHHISNYTKILVRIGFQPSLHLCFPLISTNNSLCGSPTRRLGWAISTRATDTYTLCRRLFRLECLLKVEDRRKVVISFFVLGLPMKWNGGIFIWRKMWHSNVMSPRIMLTY